MTNKTELAMIFAICFLVGLLVTIPWVNMPPSKKSMHYQQQRQLMCQVLQVVQQNAKNLPEQQLSAAAIHVPPFCIADLETQNQIAKKPDPNHSF
ncbi:hypothetical protein H4J46_07230 [Colwellia sp. MB02u-6]|uniref:hypothetical protein n=1 Tax=Colwellia sp. MB02u-6 TaxID=2759824 RepID=UPI0015F60AB4|nr:hypothetical protein [Colwellia sp. MB02u-6]MBA6327729.1 hypothetical protein [Colwellia sp. MB02u-6]